MAADDHLHGDQFYFHGTPHRIEDLVEPGHAPNFPSDSEPGYAYATGDPNDAWYWAERAWMDHPVDLPHPPTVYMVRPTGPVEKDPTRTPEGTSRNNLEGDVRSQHPFEIVDEMPMPESRRWFWEQED